MKRTFILLPFVLAAALVAALVLMLGGPAHAGPTVPPVLIDQSPAPNTITAPLDTAVSATYDQDINPKTVDYRSFAVHAMFTGWVSESLGVAGGRIALTPTAAFQPGEWVQVSATTATLNLDGDGPITPTVWQFWTEVAWGTAVFTDSGQLLGNDDNRGLALGDLDGDGDLDAFVGGRDGPSQVYANDGAGVFTDTGQMIGNALTLGIALGDLDGDGDLDVFESKTPNAPNRVWWNDGLGNFTDSGQGLGASNSFWAALGDLDGDGDLDAFVPNGGEAVSGQPNKVYFNDGLGTFADSGQALGMESSVGVALGDLDGDGDLDAFVANGGFWPRANKVWLNDGSGFFMPTLQLLGSGVSEIVALGDLDGDGDLDAVVTNLNAPLGEPDEVWINDGSAGFSPGQLLGSGQSVGVALGDLDADGDLDALVCQFDGGVVWLNDGAGTFSGSGQALAFCAVPGLGDLDGDGDLDAFLANSSFAPYPNEVWFNEGPLYLYLPFLASSGGD